MKIIFLAAGKWTRLAPLTHTTPKPLTKIMDKAIIEHNMYALKDIATEFILIVKYKYEKFQEYFGNSYEGVPVYYHMQWEEKWTAAAVWGIDIQEDFLLLSGDTIFHEQDLHTLASAKNSGVLVQEVKTPEKYGIFQCERNIAKSIVEKPETPIGNLASLGAYKFSPDILEMCKNVEISSRGEFEITDALNVFMQKNIFEIHRVKEYFLDISYPWNILDAQKVLLDTLEESEIRGEVQEWVHIHGNIILEKGAVIKSGTYIEGNCYIGKNSVVGPNTYLRGPSVLSEWTKVGNAVEIKNSFLGANTSVAHLSYIGDSIIGNNTNIGGGMITANLRHDKKNIRAMSKGALVDTGRYKLGVIIGDDVKTWVHVSTMPGRVIETGGMVMPGEIVK